MYKSKLSELRQNYIYTGWQRQNVVSCFHLTRWVFERKIEQVGVQIAQQRSVLLLLWIPNTNTLSTQSAWTHQNKIRPKWGMEQQTLKKHYISSVAEHFFLYMCNLFSMLFFLACLLLHPVRFQEVQTGSTRFNATHVEIFHFTITVLCYIIPR